MKLKFFFVLLSPTWQSINHRIHFTHPGLVQTLFRSHACQSLIWSFPITFSSPSFSLIASSGKRGQVPPAPPPVSRSDSVHRSRLAYHKESNFSDYGESGNWNVISGHCSAPFTTLSQNVSLDGSPVPTVKTRTEKIATGAFPFTGLELETSNAPPPILLPKNKTSNKFHPPRSSLYYNYYTHIIQTLTSNK